MLVVIRSACLPWAVEPLESQVFSEFIGCPGLAEMPPTAQKAAIGKPVVSRVSLLPDIGFTGADDQVGIGFIA